MKFLLFFSTFLVSIQMASSQSVTGEAPLFGGQTVLLNGRRITLGDTPTPGISVSRGAGLSFFSGGMPIGPFNPRSVGVTVTEDVIKACTEMEIAVASGATASSFVDNLMTRNRFNLHGIPKQKFLDAYDFYRKPMDYFGGATSVNYAQNQKRANCQVTLSISLSASINSKIKPGVSGVDPQGERNRVEADRQLTEDQLKQCQEKAGGLTVNCFPESPILNVSASNDIFNISNALNIPYSVQLNDVNLPRLGSMLGSTSNIVSNRAGSNLLEATSIDSFLTPRQRLCNCNKDNYKPYMVAPNKVAEERQKIANLVRDRLYKKFLNDYSQNREDINFFMNHRGNILNGHNEDALACKNLSQFKERANAKCTANGISQEARAKRERELFSKLRIPSPSPDLEDNWKQLDSKISTIEFPEGTTGLPENISAKGLNRIAFDEVRHGFSEDTRSRAFNKIITGLLKDQHFKEWAEGSPNETPAVRLMDYMFNIKNDPARVDAVVNMASSEQAFDRNAFKENLEENFVKLMQDVTAYSPEMRIALSSPEIFNDVMARAKKPGFKDFKTVLGNDPKAAGPDGPANLIHDKHLLHKCGQIMESFANAVCSDDNNIVDNADPDDLKKLIQENPMADIDSDYATHLTCKIDGDILKRIPLDIDAPYSSLHSRVVEMEKDFFANIKDAVLEGDKTVMSYISGMAREASDTSVEIDNKEALADNNVSIGGSTFSPRTSSGGKSSLWDHVDSSGSFSSERVYANNKLVSRPDVPSSKEKANNDISSRQDGEKTAADLTQDQTGVKDLKTTPDVPTFGTSYATRSQTEKSNESQSKTELRQTLGSDGSKPEVQQQISRIDDDMAAELNRLREEAAQNRQKLAELTSQAQESKIRMLQDQLRRLQEERRTVVEASPVPVVSPESKNDYIVSPQRTFSQNREPAADGSSESDSPVPVPGQKQSSVSNDPASVAGNSNTVRNQSRGDVSSNTETSAGSSIAPLVVTSTAVRSESNVDMNLEMIKFLDATNPDLTTLTQIKDQGLLYRYKVVVNGVEREQEVLIRFSGLNESARQALERKISQRRSENPRLAQVEDSIAEVQRKVSYESLKYIIGQQLSR